MEQNTQEWLEARRGKVTASMVGAILGLSPNMTREGALRRMVRDALGEPAEFTGNIATEYGKSKEDGAATEYHMEHLHYPAKCGFFVHPVETWLGASPDRTVGHDGLLEIKCPFSLRAAKPPTFKPLGDQPHYYAQMQIQLFVTGRAWCDFYQWAPHGAKLERVSRDEDWLDKNLPKLKDFYQTSFLEAMKDPKEYLAPLRPSVDGLAAMRAVQEWDELSEAIERAEARKKDLLAEMVQLAGGVDAKVAGRNLTKVSRVGSVSYAKALAKYAPDADLEPFRGKPSEYWVLK